MDIKINLKENSYIIHTGRNILNNISQYFDFENKKVLIITDSNIPSRYTSIIKEKVLVSDIIILNPGEETKSFENYLYIQDKLLSLKFSRNDVVIALGGGVIGDLVGFACSTYKRGIKFINIPTSTLAMIDSSIGGKTAVNFNGVKNVIGTFYQPSLVIIDFELLSSLNKRHFNNGLVEALKMGYIYDGTILNLFNDIEKNLEEIIIKSIEGKKYYVEEDEKEENIRKILNYGHTFGHALESISGFSDKLYHGEAVALGMLMISEDRDNLSKYLTTLNISYDFEIDVNTILKIVANDKKASGDYIDFIMVDQISQGYIKKISLDELKTILEGGLKYVRCFRK
jgi:3-dehydroquinate synthase